MPPSAHSISKTDPYAVVTQTIAEMIERGAGEFSMPWHSSTVPLTRPVNAFTAARYRGVNAVSLWAEAAAAGFSSGTWASYRQWASLGAQVRRGEQGALIVFYKPAGSNPPDEDAADQRRRPVILRSSFVFNADQVAGWTSSRAGLPGAETLVDVDAFVVATEARVEEAQDIACYVPSLDVVRMPPRAVFIGSATSSATEAYYAVLLHELVHWSGASHRLDRKLAGRFGDADYAFEELVAELGSAFLCGDLGVTNHPRPDHAAYLQHWLGILREDKRAIFMAARLATAASEYLLAMGAPPVD